MNKERFVGQWKIIKGLLKDKWGKLTDDDIAQIEGKREHLIGFLQKKYGYTEERAEQELGNWEKEVESGTFTKIRK
jgi:uncharacterized protein YjbJ (UPF0337 family)